MLEGFPKPLLHFLSTSCLVFERSFRGRLRLLGFLGGLILTTTHQEYPLDFGLGEGLGFGLVFFFIFPEKDKSVFRRKRFTLNPSSCRLETGRSGQLPSCGPS